RNDKEAEKEALAACREAIRLHPTSARAHYIFAQALSLFDKPDDALAAYREVIRLQPDHFECRWALARMLSSKGKLEEAATAYQQLIRLQPNHAAGAYKSLGETRMLQRRFGEALSAYERWDELEPKRLAEQGRPDPDRAERGGQLLECYKTAFAADPKLAEDVRAGHRYNAARAAVLSHATEGAKEMAQLKAHQARTAMLIEKMRTARLRAADPDVLTKMK